MQVLELEARNGFVNRFPPLKLIYCELPPPKKLAWIAAANPMHRGDWSDEILSQKKNAHAFLRHDKCYQLLS